MASLEETVPASVAGASPLDGPDQVLFLLHATAIGVVCQDAGGRIVFANPAAERILGLSLDQLMGRTSVDPRWRAIREDGSLLPGEDHPAMVSLRTGQPIQNQVMGVFHPVEGVTRWLHVSALPFVRPDEPGPYQVVATFVDITDRVEAEARTREVEQQLQLFVENAPAAIAMFDQDMKYLAVSKRWLEDYRLAGPDLIGRSHYELFPDLPQRWKEIHQRCLAGATERCDEDPFPRGDGTLDWVRWEIRPWRRRDGSVGGLILFSEVITRQKEDERALREGENKFLAFFENLKEGVAIHEIVEDAAGQSVDYRLLEANPAYETHTGLKPEAVRGRLGSDIYGTLPPPYLAEFAKVARDREPYVFETYFPPLGKHFRISVISPKQGQFATVFEDITERKAAEARLQRAQRMESLGSLAGGVAHDLNNVLGAILGVSSAALSQLAPDHPLFETLGTIRAAATRGGGVVRSLLTFARPGPKQLRSLDLNELLREEARLLERTTLAKVRLELDLAQDLRPISGDAGELAHAIMNLCINAVDAMEENGTLTLTTRNEGEAQVAVSVEDTGSGMPPDVLAKAMDPYFTTKEVGKGTGLGLAMVYATVEAHGGVVTLQSEVGRGTRVSLRFPALAIREPAAAAPHPDQQEVARAALAVLVVDDDELVRTSTRMLLEVQGHQVLCAETGEEALALLEQGARPDAVILDMNMPGLAGKGTLPRLRSLCPTVPVLLATGRADDEAMALVATHPFVTLLPKPYGFEELRGCLEQAKVR